MSIEILTTGAVSLLTLYLAKAGKTISESVGKDAWNIVNSKIEKLYNAIKNKFIDNVYANQTLKRLEEKPEDKGRQIAMENILKEFLENDQQFQKMLIQLLAEVQQAGGDSIIQVYGSGAVATHRGIAAGERGYAAGRDIIIQKNNNDKNKNRPFLDFIIGYTRDDGRLGLYTRTITDVVVTKTNFQVSGKAFEQAFHNSIGNFSLTTSLPGNSCWERIFIIPDSCNIDKGFEIASFYKDIDGKEWSQESRKLNTRTFFPIDNYYSKKIQK